MPDVERHELLATIEALPAEVTVLLIEHDMDLVFSFADRITVLVNGGLLVDGPPEVARDPRVKSVYLGEELECLICSASNICRRAMARPWFSPTSRCHWPKGRRSRSLGRNGMGKTTLINTIVGVTHYFSGKIALDGVDITRLRPDQRAHAQDRLGAAGTQHFQIADRA